MRRGLIFGLPVAVYVVLAMLSILQQPGIQYDEALLVTGAVHMLRSTDDFAVSHDPDTWIRVRGRSYPLMMVRYAGAVKDYLCLPLFAVFGTSVELARGVAMLLGAVCIVGLVRLMEGLAGARAAVAAGLIMAVNPAYVANTVFDNGTVSQYMAACGLLCLALARYLRVPGWRSAFLVGVAMGFALWARANFAWLLVSLLVASAIVLRRRLVVPLVEVAAAIVGTVLGSLPLLIYQVISRGGTFEAVGMFTAPGTLWDHVSSRWALLPEALLSDRAHRLMWDGPMMPDWQRWSIAALVLFCCGACLRTSRPAWERIAALTFLGLGAILFLTRLPVSEHHLVNLLPLAAMIAVGACSRIPCLFLPYLVLALLWQVRAVQGLSATGGVGLWSDAMYGLAEHLETQYPGREVLILDWGLQNNLFFLTEGRVRSREVYLEGGGSEEMWTTIVRRGGVFLINGKGQRSFPEGTDRFLKALAEQKPASRRFRVNQADGRTYAEIIVVEPSP